MRPTLQDLRARNGRGETRLRGLVRRMLITASDALWKVAGHEDAYGNAENDELEMFSGIGFYSRPASGARAEGIVVKVGGESGHPVLIGGRDWDLVRAIAAAIGGFGEDEAAIFNSNALVRCRDGIVEACSPGGTAVSLATKADLDAFKAHFDAHTHPCTGTTGGGGSPGVAGAPAAAPTPAGTSVLRGE